MAREGKRRRSRGGREVGGGLARLVRVLDAHAGIVAAAFLLAILAAGVYIRVAPAIRYGLELDANDPWIAYWLAKYFRDNGLFNFDGLRDVKQFWYPYGRDFLHTESLGLSWLAAATYPIGEAFGLTLRQWIALFPVFAGAAGIVLSYILVYMLARSRLAGLIAASYMAFAPSAVSRTFAGFVEKIGFSIPFILAAYIFLVKSVEATDRRARILHAALAGFFSGSIGWLWGGVELAVLTIALPVFIDMLLSPPDEEKLKIYTLASVVHVLVSGSSPSVGFSYYAANLGALLPGVLAAYALGLYYYRATGYYTGRLAAWLASLGVAAFAVLIASGALRPGARILAAIGIRHRSPLVESVSEHQPATLRAIFASMGVPLVLAVAGLVVDLYNAWVKVRREGRAPFRLSARLSIFILALFLAYASKQMSYFMQIGGFYAALGAGLALGAIYDAVEREGAEPRKRKAKSRASGYEGEPFKLVAAAAMIIIVAGSSVAYAVASYRQYAYKPPAIETSYLQPMVLRSPTGESRVVAPLNDAWLLALDYIRNNTRPDSLIVSWWDYGYWITVNTGRPTVADGATINGTQLFLLARLLTGTEGGASAILRNYFKAQPNNTYIVFYDVFVGVLDERGVLTIMPQSRVTRNPLNPVVHFVVHGGGDLAKSFQMLRIGRRVPFVDSPFQTNYTTIYNDTRGYMYIHFPGFVGGPRSHLDLVVNKTLLYKLTIYGLYNFKNAAVAGPGCADLLANATLVMPAVRATNTTVALLPQVKVTDFQLQAVIVDCPRDLIRQTSLATSALMVLVFIYKWTG